MVAGLTVGKKKYAAVDAEMQQAALDAAELGRADHALGVVVERAYLAIRAQ